MRRAASSMQEWTCETTIFKRTCCRQDDGGRNSGMPPMINFSWLPPIFAQASERLSLGQLAGSATVCLAVTGLSRSGKTVFATSLIHNLLSCALNPNRMPLLGVVGERRLIAATIASASANRLYERGRRRSALCASKRAGKARERDHGKPRDPHHPDRRLSGRVAARPAADGGELCRVVARHDTLAAQGGARRDRARLSRVAR